MGEGIKALLSQKGFLDAIVAAFFFPSLFFHVQVSTAYNWQPIDGLNEKEKRWEEKCISISGGVDIRNHRGMLDFIIHLVWGYLRQKKEKREANKLDTVSDVIKVTILTLRLRPVSIWMQHY